MRSESTETGTAGRQALVCTASIGLGLYPDNASILTGLLREADQAMYRAKARSRGDSDVTSTVSSKKRSVTVDGYR